MLRRMMATRISIVCALAPVLAAPAFAEEWRRVLHRDGVEVSARSVPGSSIWEMRAAALVPVPPEQFLSVLADTAAYPAHLPPTESVRILRQEGNRTWVYMVLRPPFVSRRDSCIRITRAELRGGLIISEWAADDEGCPGPQPGLVRIEENRGRWVLTPANGGQATAVEYLAHTDPGGRVPAWLANRGTARALPELFRVVSQAAQEPRYRAANVR